MSKASKNKRAIERRKKKRAIKEQNKAKYAAMAAAGQNKKSKRFVLRSKRTKMVRTTRHANGACGNIGCMHCSSLASMRFAA